MPAVIPILIGVSAFTAGAAIKNKKKAESATAPAPTTTAVPREGAATIGTPTPPDVGRAASDAAAAARLAADRTRKRASSTLLTQPKMTGSAPRSVLTPKTLKGY